VVPWNQRHTITKNIGRIQTCVLLWPAATQLEVIPCTPTTPITFEKQKKVFSSLFLLSIALFHACFSFFCLQFCRCTLGDASKKEKKNQHKPCINQLLLLWGNCAPVRGWVDTLRKPGQPVAYRIFFCAKTDQN